MDSQEIRTDEMAQRGRRREVATTARCKRIEIPCRCPRLTTAVQPFAVRFLCCLWWSLTIWFCWKQEGCGEASAALDVFELCLLLL